MKNIIFIDNDNLDTADKDVRKVRGKLKDSGVDCNKFENIKIVSDFSKIDKNTACDLLFNNNNIICTWSMYTATHHNSLFQFRSLLSTAGRSDVRDITYIDCSGNVIDALETLMFQEKQILPLLKGIEMNNIISFDKKDYNSQLKRVRVNLSKDDIFILENIDLNNIFK